MSFKGWGVWGVKVAREMAQCLRAIVLAEDVSWVPCTL